MKQPKSKFLLVRLPGDLHTRWSAYCRRRMVTMSAAVRTIILARVAIDTEDKLLPKPKASKDSNR